MIDKLWSMLSDKLFLFFGRECGSATIIMLISLFIRAFLRFVRLKSYIPNGFIFAFPLLMQVSECSISSIVCIRFSFYFYL